MKTCYYCNYFFFTFPRTKIKTSLLIHVMFDLILYVQSTIFKLCRDGPSCVEPVQSKDYLSCSRTHSSDAGEARTRGPSVWVKHSTTVPLYYHHKHVKQVIIIKNIGSIRVYIGIAKPFVETQYSKIYIQQILVIRPFHKLYSGL